MSRLSSSSARRLLSFSAAFSLLFCFLLPISSLHGDSYTCATANLEKVVVTAFEQTHDGYSVDEVLLHNQRRQRFIESCRKQDCQENQKKLFTTLMGLRKAGRVQTNTSKRGEPVPEELDTAAEIAARRMSDEYQVHMDQILCDPDLLQKFDTHASKLAPDVDSYLLRKAAVRLRKRRQLQPELTLQATDWQVDIQEFSLPELASNSAAIPTRPGIYIFRDPTGYLYIGQSHNLRERLTHHVKDSDRERLKAFFDSQGQELITVELHLFRPGSPGETLKQRRAYESELIRSRQPRLNIKS